MTTVEINTALTPSEPALAVEGLTPEDDALEQQLKTEQAGEDEDAKERLRLGDFDEDAMAAIENMRHRLGVLSLPKTHEHFDSAPEGDKQRMRLDLLLGIEEVEWRVLEAAGTTVCSVLASQYPKAFEF